MSTINLFKNIETPIESLVCVFLIFLPCKLHRLLVMGSCCPGSNADPKVSDEPTPMKGKAPVHRSIRPSGKISLAAKCSPGKGASVAGPSTMKKPSVPVKKVKGKKSPKAKKLKTAFSSASKDNYGSSAASSVSGVQTKCAVKKTAKAPSATGSCSNSPKHRILGQMSSSQLGLNSYNFSLSDFSDTGLGRIRTTIRFQSNRSNAFLDESEEQIMALMARRRLGQDQALKKTLVGGQDICQSTTRKLLSTKDLELMGAHGNDQKILVGTDFSTLHPIVPGLYLTALTGLQMKVLEAASVSVIINATHDMPLATIPGLLTYRVPVDDDTRAKIDVYFDDVADLLEATRRRETASVVHCVAGVSRSSTLVLAYLVKYTDMDLHAAFAHTRAIRTVVRPNMGFMAQLVEYERKVRGSASVKMITVTDKARNVKATIPDFYPKVSVF